MDIEKFYNPYPFPVKVKNDLGSEQVLSPHGGHGKVLNNTYDQSVLKLLPYDHRKKDNQLRHTKLDFNLSPLKKQELLDLAWAICVEVPKLAKNKNLVDLIKSKVEEYGGEI